jgi:hypothetical protein
MKVHQLLVDNSGAVVGKASVDVMLMAFPSPSRIWPCSPVVWTAPAPIKHQRRPANLE